MQRIGLIGTTGIAGAHLTAYRDHPERVEIAGVCDVDEDAARERSEEFEVPYWTDHEAFVTEADVDAVDICTPTQFHAEMTEAALEAGLHVLCEKPLARSVAEARPLVDLAESEGLTLMPAQCLRYGRGERAIGAALRDGDLGRVHHARLTAMSNGLPRGQDGDAVGGGIVMEVLIHDIDLLRYLVGDVTRVSARALTTRPEWVNGAEDHCVATLETASGAVVDLLGLHSAAAIPPYARYQFTGGDAVVTESIGGDRGPWIGRREADGSAGAFERLDIDAVDLPTDDWYVNEILAFADCVASGETPVADPRDNLDTLATIEAIYESADRGGEQVPVDAGA